MKSLFLLAFLAYFLQCTSGYYFEYGIRIRSRQQTCRIPRKCGVKILRREFQQYCRYQRQLELKRARHWYQIATESNDPNIPFPLKHIPWLNQTGASIGAYYATDDFEAGYFGTFLFYIRSIAVNILKAAKETFKNAPYETSQEFIAVKRFTEIILQNKVKNPLFGNPTMYPDFTDHITNNYWQTDDAFSQRRVAGQCPFTLRKITDEGKKIGMRLCELKEVINKEILSMKFDTGKNKLTFREAVDEGRLFVQYYEVMDNVKTDYPDETPTSGKKMRPVTSTLTFFIINDEGHLAVVAIQTDSKPTAPVFTPNSPKDAWQIAKIIADSVHESYCQSYIHVGETHYIGTVFCLSFRRHLSERHPLYDLLKFHCEGTVVHISTVQHVVDRDGGTLDLYYAIGNDGFAQIANEAFLDREYGKFDYVNIINKRGLDDPRIKYYPFRDDVKLILAEYKTFARRFTKMYYQYGFFYRRDLTPEDIELQNWAKELSVGLGEVPGFPKYIRNHKMLEDVIVRFLWINVLHAVSSYATEPNFIPISASKVYEADGNGKLSPNQVFFNGSTAAAIASIRGRLSNFRVNRIFDYFDKVKDSKYGELVRQTHSRLHSCVQQKLMKRNAERKKRNQLGYQFIEPKWMTNSIHI